MHRFQSAGAKWWQKPLISADGGVLPAELAVLALELGPREQGVWMNSRGTSSGVAELLAHDIDGQRSFSTRRQPLPPFVSKGLTDIYKAAGIAKGCPDLVIWRIDRETFRLVEVKCPHWDAPTVEQEQFMQAASHSGVITSIVEWEFDDVVA